MNTVFYRGGLANDYVICAQPLWVLLLIHGISTTHRRSLGLLMVWWFVKIYRSLFQNANECRRKNWVIKPQGTACPCGISLDIGVWRIWSGLKRLRRAWSILLFVIIDYTLRAQRFVQLLLLFISKYPPEGEMSYFCENIFLHHREEYFCQNVMVGKYTKLNITNQTYQIKPT